MPGFVVSGGMSKQPTLRVVRPALATIDTRTVRPPEKVAEPFYQSAEWRVLMKQVIAERGMRCEDPECTRMTAPSRVFGDHVVELRDGGAALDPANILLRCGACHTRKTIAARAARARS